MKGKIILSQSVVVHQSRKDTEVFSSLLAAEMCRRTVHIMPDQQAKSLSFGGLSLVTHFYKPDLTSTALKITSLGPSVSNMSLQGTLQI